MTDRDALMATASELGPDELRVLRLLAARLALGRRQYGALDLDRDTRDFGVEAVAEAADLAIYLGMMLCRETLCR
ncbi:hypothetical protein L6Q96_01850 [Candidatus Binatia bacterium]|nr:hypothetical protein [Candidatus Binatia bacterium]